MSQPEVKPDVAGGAGGEGGDEAGGEEYLTLKVVGHVEFFFCLLFSLSCFRLLCSVPAPLPLLLLSF